MVSALVRKDTSPAHWLSICRKGSIWPQLPKVLGVRGLPEDQNEYFRYVHGQGEQLVVTYLSLNFPEDHFSEALYPWGIAWLNKETTEGFVNGFISMLPYGCVPHSPFELFQQFLDHLHQKWNEFYSRLSDRVEELVG